METWLLFIVNCSSFVFSVCELWNTQAKKIIVVFETCHGEDLMKNGDMKGCGLHDSDHEEYWQLRCVII